MNGARAGVALLLALIVSGCAGTAAREDPGPDAGPLVVTDMDGRRHDLDATLARGGTVALVFWQTWCESCAHEAPGLAAAARAHGARISFLGVVPGRAEVVDEGEVRAVAKRWGYDAFPQVRDADLALSRRLDVSGTPTIVVLGAGRKRLFHGHRPPEAWEPYHGQPAQDPPADCVDGVCPLPGQ